MLQGCDYAVGSYSSPHLTDLRERIQIDGQLIPHAQFVSVIKAVAEAADSLGIEPTFFEIMTAVAFKHFADEASSAKCLKATAVMISKKVGSMPSESAASATALMTETNWAWGMSCPSIWIRSRRSVRCGEL